MAFLSTVKAKPCRIQSPETKRSYAQSSDEVVIKRFGTSGIFKYDLKKGEFNVQVDNKVILSAIYATARLGKVLLNSKTYTNRKVSETTLRDSFGNGLSVVIRSTSIGQPEMRQTFYLYPGREYFLTELSISGKLITSNYLSPINGHFSKIGIHPFSLITPFDNDTFISYEARDFSSNAQINSSEVGVIFDPSSRSGIITGSVEHQVWKTGIHTKGANGPGYINVWSGYTDPEVTRDHIAHGSLSGSTVKSSKIFIGYYSDWRKGLEAYGEANRLADPPYIFHWSKPTPVGWNSWGVMKEHITLDKVTKVADFFSDSIPAFRNGKTVYIDLDSYWDVLIKGNDFTKLKSFVSYCHSKGLEAGIYWAPFVDWGHRDGPDRLIQGSKYHYGESWTKIGKEIYHDLDGARAMDPTHPGTQQRITYMINQFKECGFSMIKIDFLGHAAIESGHFYDKSTITGMQAYRKGMEFLIDQLDGKMLVYAAISPNLATGRYAHSRRIACDAFKTIEQTEYTLNSVTYGWWQSFLYDFIDADHVVFEKESVGVNRARLLSALITGTVFTGDDYSVNGPWATAAKELLQSRPLLDLLNLRKSFMPVESAEGKSSSALFISSTDKVSYLAVFNFQNKPKEWFVNFRRLGIEQDKINSITEVFNGRPFSVKAGNINFSMNKADAALYRIEMNTKR